MLAINETKSVGNAYRICIDDSDPTNLRWERESFWTAASDVEFNDGKTAEQKMNEINTTINGLNNNINQLFQSASDGKSLIASTLTGLGVSTALDATYQTMSDNIKVLATNKYNEGYSTGYNIGYGDGFQVAEFNGMTSNSGMAHGGKRHYLKNFTYYSDLRYYEHYDDEFGTWISCDPNNIKSLYYIAITSWRPINYSDPWGRFSIGFGNDPEKGIFIDSNFEFASLEGKDSNETLDVCAALNGFFVYK